MTDKEFCAQILAKALVQADAEIRIQGLPASSHLNTMLETESLIALKKIRDVLDDDSLEDRECFRRIEGIVSVFETLGPGAGSRHDFG